MLEFSQSDLLRGTVLEPDWYEILIEKVDEQISKKGDSTNYWFEGTIVKNASNGATEKTDKNGDAVAIAGVPLRWNINSKFSSTLMALLELFEIKPKLNQRYDMQFFSGKKIIAFVKNDLWEGRLINRVENQYKRPTS